MECWSLILITSKVLILKNSLLALGINVYKIKKAQVHRCRNMEPVKRVKDEHRMLLILFSYLEHIRFQVSLKIDASIMVSWLIEDACKLIVLQEL